jgi:hypothetical protein
MLVQYCRGSNLIFSTTLKKGENFLQNKLSLRFLGALFIEVQSFKVSFKKNPHFEKFMNKDNVL